MEDPNVLLGTYEHNLEEASRMTLEEVVMPLYDIFDGLSFKPSEDVASVVNVFRMFGDVTADDVAAAWHSAIMSHE